MRSATIREILISCSVASQTELNSLNLAIFSLSAELQCVCVLLHPLYIRLGIIFNFQLKVPI